MYANIDPFCCAGFMSLVAELGRFLMDALTSGSK